MPCFVYLLSHTPEPDELVAAASRICYSDATVCELLEKETPQHSRSLLKKLLKSGHLSPFEHASFTFGVDGLSRVASHQLVRHRIASYSQQSQRYVSMETPDVVLPRSIASHPEASAVFQEEVSRAHAAYKKLMALGIPAEDARFILPHGWQTRIIFTMNGRELLHFFQLRLCRRAQWEIRELARQMLAAVRRKAPIIFENAGPSCLSDGKCREIHSCGEPYQSMEELLEKPSGL